MSKDRGVYKRGDTWCIRFAVNGRQVREAVGPSKKLATEVRAMRILEVAEGRYFPERTARRRQTVGEAIDAHLERIERTHKDLVSKKTHAAFWRKHLGNRALRDVRSADVEKILAKIQKDGGGPATVNRYRTFIQRIFTMAVDDQEVVFNPVARIKRAKEPSGRTRMLAPDEEQRLARQLPDPIAWARVQFAIHTGMRQGEQWNAKWSDLALDVGQIYIPKTKSGVPRWVPLNAAARAALETLREASTSELICPGDAANFQRRVFVPACERAGLVNLHWHDLRHTFASRLVMAGVDLSAVQKLLGHSTITMTTRYAHLTPGHLRDAVAKIERRGRETEVAQKVAHGASDSDNLTESTGESSEESAS